jgi:phenylpropionate dioxygenase-like ring-hydroxylating dioxygenase large terminal subunit
MKSSLDMIRRLHGAEGLSLLRRDWLALARSSQLPEAGSFLTVSVLDQPILLVRDETGVVRALANVCSHRHATLAEGAGRTGRLVCPYHAWSYGLNGRFLSAPCVRGELSDSNDLSLHAYAAIEWQGWILVCLDGHPSSPADRAPALDAHLSDHSVSDWVIARTLDYPSAWNWSLMVENFTESYHHLAVHRTTLQPRWPASETYGVETNGSYSELRHPVDMDEGTFTVFALFPALLFALQSPQPIMFWPRILPKDSSYFDLCIHILAPATVAADDDMMDASAAAIDQIHREDIPVMERVWRGSRSAVAKPSIFVTLEQPLRLFHSYVQAVLEP